MKTNPGGLIPPDEVVGRDELIARVWRVLERQSVVLTAERRMGKTSVIKKMIAEPRLTGTSYYQDLEGVFTPIEFVEKIVQKVRGDQAIGAKVQESYRQFMQEIGGTEIGGIVKLPGARAHEWGDILEKCITGLLAHKAGLLIFFWDELPLMIYNIAAQSGESEAMKVLDRLRALRQREQRLRMVFTGSIGLHNVLQSLRRRGHANDVTNDMSVIEVPPLTPTHSDSLALSLLRSEGFVGEEFTPLGRAISAAVDGIPYFIHHIVDLVAQSSGSPTESTIATIVDEQIQSPFDPWHLRYFETRIVTYYGDDAKLALDILDLIASESGEISEEETFERLVSSGKRDRVDREWFKTTLLLLRQDHYLLGGSNALRFKFSIVLRAWRRNRSIS